MYEHILVALDGSPAAEHVLPHVEALATAFRSTVTLVRATLSAEMVVAQTAAGDATVGQLPIDQHLRDNTDDFAACCQRRIGQDSHQADIAGAIDDADAALSQQPAKCRRSRSIFRPHADRRTTENTNRAQL